MRKSSYVQLGFLNYLFQCIRVLIPPDRIFLRWYTSQCRVFFVGGEGNRGGGGVGMVVGVCVVNITVSKLHSGDIDFRILF